MSEIEEIRTFLKMHSDITADVSNDEIFTKKLLNNISFPELDSFYDFIKYIGENENPNRNISIENRDSIIISIMFNCPVTLRNEIWNFMEEQNINSVTGSKIKKFLTECDFYNSNFLNLRITEYDSKKQKFNKIYFKTCSYGEDMSFSRIESERLYINKKHINFTISNEDNFEEFKKLILKCKGIYKSPNSEIFIAKPIFKKVR